MGLIIGNIVYAAVLLLAVLATALGLPGTVLVLISSLLYALATKFTVVTGTTLLGLLAVTVVAETADNWVQAAAAKKGGASGGAVGVALLGGIAGAIVFWPLLGGVLTVVGLTVGPLGFLVSAGLAPFLGALLGATLAAYLWERRRGTAAAQAWRAARSTAIGRLWGTLLKMGLVVGMVAFLLARLFW